MFSGSKSHPSVLLWSSRVKGRSSSSVPTWWICSFFLCICMSSVCIGMPLDQDAPTQEQFYSSSHPIQRSEVDLTSPDLSFRPFNQPEGEQQETGGMDVSRNSIDEKSGLVEYFDPENPTNEQVGQQWEMVLDPKFYIQTERETTGTAGTRQQRRRRNAGPSLSIVNPLDVLRQRLLIEIARRRFHLKNQQIKDNREFLKHIGR